MKDELLFNRALNQNKPAFPIFLDGGIDYGLTKREYFAGLAMQALISARAWDDDLAIEAVKSADALLLALDSGKQ